jgi:hypothetical protein
MFVLDFIIRNTGTLYFSIIQYYYLDRLNANYLINVTDPSAEAVVIPESKTEAKEVIIDIVSEPSSSGSGVLRAILNLLLCFSA